MSLIDTILDTRGYLFWLTSISIFCFVLERIAPWRKTQKWPRTGLLQDFFYLIFNGHYVGILLAFISAWVLSRLAAGLQTLGMPYPGEFRLLASVPLWGQFAIFIVLKDFLEWCVHYLLHSRRWLWQFHKLHHSIVELDWIGNFRFHWMEIIVYRTLTWLPLVIMGVDGRVMLWIAIVTTLIGHLNHSNVRIDWGPLRYLLNSARMHVWHHDLILHHRNGQNFAVIFSVWDWIFKTAHFPYEEEGPEQLGFHDLDRYPTNLFARLIYPIPLGKR